MWFNGSATRLNQGRRTSYDSRPMSPTVADSVARSAIGNTEPISDSCFVYLILSGLRCASAVRPKVLLIYDVTTRPLGTSFDDKTTDFRSEINRIWKARVWQQYARPSSARHDVLINTVQLNWLGRVGTEAHPT